MRVGVVGPFTGPSADFGVPMLNGIKLAVDEINEQLVDGAIVSSTLIRNCITEKNIQQANNLLGYPYAFEGFVVRGNQLGRTIGFPTANLQLSNSEKLIPAFGSALKEAIA